MFQLREPKNLLSTTFFDIRGDIYILSLSWSILARTSPYPPPEEIIDHGEIKPKEKRKTPVAPAERTPETGDVELSGMPLFRDCGFAVSDFNLALSAHRKSESEETTEADKWMTHTHL